MREIKALPVRKAPFREARMSRWDIRMRAMRRAWNDETFWVTVGEQLAAWGCWAVIILAGVLMFAGWLRLGG